MKKSHNKSTDLGCAAYHVINSHYETKNGPMLHPIEYKGAVTDLITDLMLWADDDEFIDQCLSTARLHYWAEKEEQL